MGQVQAYNDTAATRREQVVAGSEVERIVLVEPRALIRDSLKALLTMFLRDVVVEAYANPNSVVAGQTRLVMIGLDSQLLAQGQQLERWLNEIHDVCGDVPIGVIVLEHAPALMSKLMSLGVVGLVQPDDGIELAVAAIRVMMVGGFCLPPTAWTPDNEIAAASGDAIVLAQLAQTKTLPAEASAELHQCSANGSSRECNLTSRECDVLRILRAGRQNKIIAHELGISESTVKVHLRNIMKKLHATNRTQVALGTIQF